MAVRVDFFDKKFRLTMEKVWRQIKDAGLRMMPGGRNEKPAWRRE